MSNPPLTIAPSSPPASASPRTTSLLDRPWFALAAIAAAVLLAYANSFSGVFVFDDRPTILENLSIRDLRDLSAVLSPPLDNSASGRPFANLTFAVNYALGGLDPTGYHVANLLIHLAAAFALFGVVRHTLLLPRLAGRFGSVAMSVALCVALLWALHPLQTETITYIVQRVEALAACFYLLTVYCFVRSVNSRRAIRWQLLALAACLLGMGSKEVTVSAPLFVLLYDRTLVSGSFRAAWRQRRWFYLGLAATWLPLGLLILAAENRAGTAGFGAASSWHYLLTQCHAIAHYLRLSLWPSPLVFDYGKTLLTSPSLVIPQAVLLLALLGATLHGVWRRSPWALLGAWFFAILAPSSSIVPVATQTIAEHRMYLPLAAVIVWAVLAVHGFVPRIARAVAIGFAILCVGLTIQRNADYHSELRLWAATAADRPDNPRAHSMLGQSFFNLGQIENAVVRYQTALTLNPDHFEARNNLGIALAAVGRFVEAEPHFRAAARLEPAYAQVHSNLGMALHALGREEEAVRELETALRLRPDHADAHSNLCLVLNALGRTETALQHGREALRQNPRHAEAHNNLGMTLQARGDLTEGARALRGSAAVKTVVAPGTQQSCPAPRGRRQPGGSHRALPRRAGRSARIRRRPICSGQSAGEASALAGRPAALRSRREARSRSRRVPHELRHGVVFLRPSRRSGGRIPEGDRAQSRILQGALFPRQRDGRAGAPCGGARALPTRARA